jgi:hypothetical protein
MELLMVLVVVSVSACKHEPDVLPVVPPDSYNPNNQNPAPIVGSSGDTIKDSICFAEEILPMILSNCAKSGCHDAAANTQDLKPLISFITVKHYVQAGSPSQSELYQSITANGQDLMPPNGNAPLTAAQINLIYDWIVQGAKQNIDCGMGCDTSLYTYSGAIRPILQNYCTGCHNATTTGGGISLLTYPEVMVTVNNGKFWGSVKHLQGFYAMPLNTAMLDSCHLIQIKKWIDAGALNN